MRVIEAVVESFTDYSWGNAPRKKAQRFAESNWHRANPGFQPRDSTTKWVERITLREDGWLEIEEGIYGNEPLELFPPVCVMYLRIMKESDGEN